jgi:hypothetical protein
LEFGQKRDEKGMEKLLLSSGRTIDFAKFGRLYLNKRTGRKSDCFKSMGRAVNTYRS